MNTQRRTIGLITCFAVLLTVGSYASLDATQSSATPDPATTTTSPPAPTTTLRDRADGLPFKLADPTVFPTSVTIPAIVGAGDTFEVAIACPYNGSYADIGGFSIEDPNPVDLTFPEAVDFQTGAVAKGPDDDGVVRMHPVAPSETGTYFIRAACTEEINWKFNGLFQFSDGRTYYSVYMYTPPELIHRIDVVSSQPAIATLPECR
ncbi:unannotated protein [freshwater metagenome]|uniref:Unannotated protein n=1 Tax=freshwater metagenome TaxID=449393 RepID=A0A6J7F7F1_9ZZZZ|nr:hypothetical protein [Actinomycetota bacterium]